MTSASTQNLIDGRLVRGLTLHRPWPWCFTHAGKRIENRDWPAPRWLFGGYLALHSGKHFDHYACADMRRGEFGAPARQCPDDPGEHPDSVVFAIAKLTGVYRLVSRGRNPWAFGPYCWQLEEFVALPSPVPCRGFQKLWALPPDVFERVVEQLGKAA